MTAVAGSDPAGTVTIGPETPDEHDAIRAVVEAAFVTQDSVGDLVELIRRSPAFVPRLSLVARDGGEVVGHVMLSHVDLVEDDGARHRALTLSPLSVSPARQREGIGGALVRAGLRAADELGEPVVVLEGNPRYYMRFGFRPASEVSITVPLPEGVPAEAAMAYPLAAYRPAVRGTLRYPQAFLATGTGR